jgi:hypothetical protein
MTRARTASYGVGTPPPLDRWIDAVLMLFVSLVQGVATTFGMGRRIRARDWHARAGSSALPQTKPDIHIKEATPATESRAALCRTSLPDRPKGQATAPSEDHTRKSPNHGTNTQTLEACNARVPGEGRGPASAQRALLPRTVFAVSPAGARPARARNDGTRASKPSLS